MPCHMSPDTPAPKAPFWVKPFLLLSSTRMGGRWLARYTPHIDHLFANLSGGRFTLAGLAVPMLLLTTTGRRSGQARCTPVMYLPWEGHYALLASNGGQPSHPAWFLNLQDTPACQISVDGRQYDVQAIVTQGEQRKALWQVFITFNPGFARYQQRLTRQIPIVLLKTTT